MNSVNCNIQKKGKYHAKEYRRHRSPNRRPEGTEKTADEIVTSCSTSETDLDDALKRNKQFAKKHKKTRKKTNDRDEPESDSDSSEQDDTQVDSYAVPYGAY